MYPCGVPVETLSTVTYPVPAGDDVTVIATSKLAVSVIAAFIVTDEDDDVPV